MFYFLFKNDADACNIYVNSSRVGDFGKRQNVSRCKIHLILKKLCCNRYWTNFECNSPSSDNSSKGEKLSGLGHFSNSSRL